MFAPVHPVRDSGVGIALILQALLESGQKASKLFGLMPHYEFVKVRVEFENIAMAQERLRDLPNRVRFDSPPDSLDGFKWNFEDGWVQARASNTEPIIRVFAEAPTHKRAEQLAAEVRRCFAES
jgi:phosphomannomutase